MKITLFGATGGTGSHVLKGALDAGHTVTTLVRTPAKLTLTHPLLTIIQGDITKPQQVADAVAGADAVISTLGPANNRPTFTISAGMKNILTAMKQHGVKRLIATAGAGVGNPQDQAGGFDKFMNILLRAFSKYVVLDMEQVAAMVRESSLDWTIARAPMLLDQPGTGKPTGRYLGPGFNPRLPREDFAAFILTELEKGEWVQRAPVVCI